MPLLQLAKVLKSNGTDGGLLVGFRDCDPNEISLEEPVFVEFDGLPVPFFFVSLTPRGNSRAIVRLNDVSSLSDAEELVGKTLWIEDEDADDEEEDLMNSLLGWEIVGAGTVTGVLDIPANPCLEIETKNGTVCLVPFHEDLIRSVDADRRSLTMEIPAGLLDL